MGGEKDERLLLAQPVQLTELLGVVVDPPVALPVEPVDAVGDDVDQKWAVGGGDLPQIARPASDRPLRSDPRRWGQPDQLVPERATPRDVLHDELGDLVAVAPDPALRSLQCQQGASRYVAVEVLGFDSLGVVGADVRGTRRRGNDDHTPVRVLRIDDPLSEEVRVPRITQLQGVDDAGGALSSTERGQPGDPQREQPWIVLSVQPRLEPWVNPQRAAAARGGQVDHLDLGSAWSVTIDPGLEQPVLELGGGIDKAYRGVCHLGRPTRLGHGSPRCPVRRGDHAMSVCRWQYRTMRAVVQCVSEAAVEVGGATIAEIGPGLVVLVGVERGDGDADADALADKLANLRIMSDEQGRMNLSLLDTGGAALVVSQFTLLGAVRRGRRPSWDAAAKPEDATGIVEGVVDGLSHRGVTTSSGLFGATMRLRMVNEGPVTLVIEVREGRVL